MFVLQLALLHNRRLLLKINDQGMAVATTLIGDKDCELRCINIYANNKRFLMQGIEDIEFVGVDHENGGEVVTENIGGGGSNTLAQRLFGFGSHM